MHKNSGILLRLLLNRYHSGESGALLKALPEEIAKEVGSMSLDSGEIEPFLKKDEQVLKKVHYSWLIPSIEKIEKEKWPLIFSILPESIVPKLKIVLKEDVRPLNLTDFSKSFFLSLLDLPFKMDEALPLEYLPETDLTFLAHTSKDDLIRIVDFLGLYDLADEIQHTVAKQTLEKIYHCLSDEKTQFLKHCLYQKDKLVAQRLQLEQWDGNCRTLNKMLHQRGLIRLGYGLSGQHKDLIWHITHVMDTGRAAHLSRYCSKEIIPGVTEALKKQLFNIIKFFKQESGK